MFFKFTDAISRDDNRSCKVAEFPFPKNGLGLSELRISERYPTSGKVLNRESEVIYYGIFGTGLIHTSDGDYPIEVGCALNLEKGKWHWIQVTSQELALLVISVPSWTLQQSELVIE